MLQLRSRIRRARARSALTQAELAKRLGVKRSAVSQWEAAAGTTPSVAHLTQIACETGVCFEWLATGRGPEVVGPEVFESPVLLMDYAQDELESTGLAALRQMSPHKKQVAVSIIELLAR
jgi:transcriptional regulator with XRE-family HTH domain